MVHSGCSSGSDLCHNVSNYTNTEVTNPNKISQHDQSLAHYRDVNKEDGVIHEQPETEENKPSENLVWDFATSSTKETTDSLISEIERCTVHQRPLIFVISVPEDSKLAMSVRRSFSKLSPLAVILSESPPMDQCLSYLTRLERAAFVLILSKDSAQSEHFAAWCQALTAKDGERVAVGLLTCDVAENWTKKAPFLSDLVTLRYVDDFGDNELVNVSKRLQKLITGEMINLITSRLTVRREDVIELEITLNKSRSEGKKDNLKTARGEVAEELANCQSNVRQSLLKLFKAKNVRLANDPEADALLLEILTANERHRELIVAGCKRGKIDHVFSTCFAALQKRERFWFRVQVRGADDEDSGRRSWCGRGGAATGNGKGKARPRHLAAGDRQLGGDGLKPETWRKCKKSAALGRTAKAMVDRKSGHHAYDLYSQIEKNKHELDMRAVQDDGGRNLLHMIVESGRSEFFEVVFYADVWRPLYSDVIPANGDACYEGCTPRTMAERLLYRDGGPAVLREFDHFDELWRAMSPLHGACLRGSLRDVTWLTLDGGDDVNGRDRAGSTCLLYACAAGGFDVVRMLMANGADPTLSNDRGENALIMAARYGKADVVACLLSSDFHFARDHEDRSRLRAVDYPAVNGDLTTMRAFADNGMPPDSRSVPLAAKYGRQGALAHLLGERRLDVSAKDEDGRTALLHAAACGDVKLLKLLLEHGADLLEADDERLNCLHLAVQGDHRPACELLVEAARRRHVLEQLIDAKNSLNEKKHGVVVQGKVNSRDAWHYVVFTRTAESKYKAMLNSDQLDVGQLGRVIASGFGRWPGEGNLERHEWKVDELTESRLPDLTPLAMAVYLDRGGVASLLLDSGASVDVVDYYGNTPLHLAAMTGNLELVRRLHRTQEDATRRNVDGHTPADIAEQNDHVTVKNFFNAEKYMKRAEPCINAINRTKEQLSMDRLGSLRDSGEDLRIYFIDALRQLTVAINQVLVRLDSGPVVEETTNVKKHKPQYAGP